MTAVATVNRALDRYVARMRRRGVTPKGVSAVALAAVVRVPVSSMSSHLQEYRRSQQTGTSRYVVACEEYGPKSRWFILSRPDSDPAEVQEARRLHAIWVAHDAANRATRDGLYEVRPGLRGGAHDAAILAVQEATEAVLAAQLELANRLLGP